MNEKLEPKNVQKELDNKFVNEPWILNNTFQPPLKIVPKDDTALDKDEDEFLKIIALIPKDEAIVETPLEDLEMVENVENTEGGDDDFSEYSTENFTQPTPSPLAEYEIKMPVDYWNQHIKPELNEYGLHEAVQPTEFINYLVVNKDKLKINAAKQDVPIQTIEKPVDTFKFSMTWKGVALIAAALTAYIFYRKFGKIKINSTITSVSEKWFT